MLLIWRLIKERSIFIPNLYLYIFLFKPRAPYFNLCIHHLTHKRRNFACKTGVCLPPPYPLRKISVLRKPIIRLQARACRTSSNPWINFPKNQLYAYTKNRTEISARFFLYTFYFNFKKLVCVSYKICLHNKIKGNKREIYKV